MNGCRSKRMKHVKAWLPRSAMVSLLVAGLLSCTATLEETANAERSSPIPLISKLEVELIHTEVRQRETALFAGDYEAHLESAHPVLFAIGGGRASVAQKLKSGRSEFSGMILKRITFPLPPKFMRGVHNEFAIVPVTSIVSINGDLVEASAFQLGVRRIGNSEWKYLDGSRMDKGGLAQLFPDFPSESELPETAMKTLGM